MKRETLVILVKLVLDTSLQSASETALEIRAKLKMKISESEKVKLVEATMLGCVVGEDQGSRGSKMDDAVN